MSDGLGMYVLVYLMIAVFFIIGGCVGQESIRKEAVANGAGYYSINPTNGATRFEWRKCE